MTSCVSGDRKILICNKAHTNAGGYERTLKMLAAWWLILDSVIFVIQLLDTFQSLGVTETYLEEVISTSSFSIVLEMLFVRYKNVTLLSIMKPYYENEHKVHNQSRLPRQPLFWYLNSWHQIVMTFWQKCNIIVNYETILRKWTQGPEPE